MFAKDVDHAVDLSRLSESATSFLRAGCHQKAFGKYVSFRSAEYFRTYCLKFKFPDTKPEHDVVRLDDKSSLFLKEAWRWISAQKLDLNDTTVDLWLVPLTDGCFRQVVPHLASSEVIYPPQNASGDFMKRLDSLASFRAPLVDVDASCLDDDSLGLILNSSKHNPGLRVSNGENMLDFARWLSKSALWSTHLKENTSDFHWARYSAAETSIAILDQSAILPEVESTQFLDASEPYLTLIRELW
ncbi:hypothetical protein BJ875DRAFT_484947 [Amylocarpus encephaloides]|uniref:BTB domain-containing protein n=1 Tax=Amylocarpus encephaloides TaxID=45428 RepID=A0A9P7YHF7_9HELO|nr:hypothetical protein BJ875DRAFT_484947 [Amylocarpus encephaloides]